MATSAAKGRRGEEREEDGGEEDVRKERTAESMRRARRSLFLIFPFSALPPEAVDSLKDVPCLSLSRENRGTAMRGKSPLSAVSRCSHIIYPSHRNLLLGAIGGGIEICRRILLVPKKEEEMRKPLRREETSERQGSKTVENNISS